MMTLEQIGQKAKEAEPLLRVMNGEKKNQVLLRAAEYLVKDTEFISVASHNEANPDVKSAVRSFPLATKEDQVVKRALRASRRRLAVSTPGIMCFLHRLLGKVIPKKWLLYCWELFRRIG